MLSLRSTLLILLVTSTAIPWISSARAHHDTVAPTGHAECVCPEARGTDGWCSACKAGYVGGVRVDSEALYEIIDPSGHEVDPASIACRDCSRAIAQNGYCETSSLGYVKGRAYASRLSYLLALGTPIDAQGIACAECRSYLETSGWCGTCSQGLVGHVGYRDRNLYDQVQRERTRLLEASLRLTVCEYCAVAAFADGRCPRCDLVYQDGKPSISRRRS